MLYFDSGTQFIMVYWPCLELTLPCSILANFNILHFIIVYKRKILVAYFFKYYPGHFDKKNSSNIVVIEVILNANDERSIKLLWSTRLYVISGYVLTTYLVSSDGLFSHKSCSEVLIESTPFPNMMYI